ncbi:MAG: helix-turn-helix transcriptional regulator, partial [Planctomycetota bacterium]|nr:helix-turn-helix transcriptional regulator [Planctomycetota bacterium]
RSGGMKIERELMRGAGPVAVLKLLQQGEMYGYELVEALSSRTEGVLAMGQSTLYPMLYNLEAKGLVRSKWRDAENGRSRKYYALTGKGEKRLSAETKQWNAIVGAMESIGVVTGQRVGGRVMA